MAHFRALTMGKPVVMGRKSYQSPSRKPLPVRTNIVVSRAPAFVAPWGAGRGEALVKFGRHGT
jgi:dihydrofolate reductase